MSGFRSGLGLRDRVVSNCVRLLTKPLGNYVQRVPNNIEKLKKTLQKGDILLVEGDQRVSQVIRYLTQSSWSHSALYVGDELLRGDPRVAADMLERFGADARHLLIEAVVGEGVILSPVGKYEVYNIRLCRPRGLRRGDVEKVLAQAISHLGDRYDVRNVLDLARYFFPVSVVPRRWRRAALHFGSGSDREVICSSMIAKAFHLVGYPITPQVTIEPNGAEHPWWHRIVSRNGHRPIARFHRQDPCMITPRDFDLSPYFEIVKFNHLADPRFDYRSIVWDGDVPVSGIASANGNGNGNGHGTTERVETPRSAAGRG
jgi:hypothetical protein